LARLQMAVEKMAVFAGSERVDYAKGWLKA
jgi:hypothetical protein